MARLIDADALKKAIMAEPWKEQINAVRLTVDYINIIIDEQPSVDAVPLEQYNDLREDFVDYVCCGATNPAPFCKNKFAGCVDGRGWCMQTKWCRGFNPDGEGRANETD